MAGPGPDAVVVRALAVNAELLACVTLAATGGVTAARVWVADLCAARTLVAFTARARESRLRPLAEPGTPVALVGPGLRLHLRRAADAATFALTAHWPGGALTLDFAADAAPSPLVAGPADAPELAALHGLPTRGALRLGTRLRPLDAAWGALARAAGPAARHAVADVLAVAALPGAGTSVALALTDGAHTAMQHAIWFGPTRYPLIDGVAMRRTSLAVQHPWTVEADGGAIALTFRPRAHDGASGAYAGFFSGQLGEGRGGVVLDLPGLCREPDA